MADFIRAQVSAWHTTDPKLDKITNTVYFQVADWGSYGFMDTQDPDWDAIANDVKNAFTAGLATYLRGINKVQVKVYDMEDAEPRTPKSVSEANVASLAAGVREVALCLSFRGAANTARQRGRLYLGPFESTVLAERPTAAVRTAVHDLADRLANIGGSNVDWCVFSPTTLATGGSLSSSFHPVKHSWVDDAWDTQRRRGLPASVRATKTHDE